MLASTLLTIIGIYALWAINGFIAINRGSTKCNEYCSKYDKWYFSSADAVSIVYNHYSPFRLRSWFGFRSWFVPFRPEDYK